MTLGSLTRIDARVDFPLPLVPQMSTTTHLRRSLKLCACVKGVEEVVSVRTEGSTGRLRGACTCTLNTG